MFDINGSTIRLTRGDTLYLKITLSKDGEAFTPDDSDTIRFAMKQSFSDVGWLLMREIHPSSGEIILEIKPEDTKKLSFGTYKYDLALVDSNERVNTFVIGDFIVTEEVY